jgi:hypothetical protein
MSNEHPENHLTPIEQLLNNPEPPQDELAGALLDAYYAPLFQLSSALLKAPYEAAHNITLDILSDTICESQRLRGKSGPQVAIYQIALRMLGRARGEYASAAIDEKPEQQDLLRWINRLGDKERQFFLLYYLLNLPIPQVAQILHVGEGAAGTQIEIFQEQLANLLEGQEQHTHDILAEIWPAPQPSQDERAAYITHMLDCAARRKVQKARHQKIRSRVLLAAGALGLLLIVIGTGLYLWNARGEVDLPPPSDPQAASTLTLEVAPLTSDAASDEIKLRLLDSSQLWNTLWADVQMTDYSPSSYIGPAKSYRAQVWMHQPAESLEVFGQLGDKPNSVYILYNDQELYENPVAGESFIRTSTDLQPELLHNASLQQIFFPERGPWFTEGGTLEATSSATIAGRRCVVVDWIDPQGQRLSQLWLDAGSGLILKRQDYSPGPNPQLTFEALVSDIRYESQAPPVQITDWMSLENLSLRTINERKAPGKGQVTPTPTLAAEVIQRELLSREALPPELAPDQAALIFQYPQGEELADIQTGTADVPAELFADGYFLGEVRFAIPWGLHCERSADGSRIAFNTASDGTTRADRALRWFSLEDPGVIYQPFPDFTVIDFSFAPDSRYLAAAAQSADQTQNGIYLLDVATGEFKRLVEIYAAESLVWSLDGEYLAYLGQAAQDQPPAPSVVHANTGIITHQIELERLNTAAYEEWPVFAWEVDFPKQLGGMQACAQAPNP